jgi:DedD protein
MARAISDEEQQLKKRARRRLIGAVVLVAAIVVVLPMVLDSEPKPAGQPISVQIPSPDSGGFTSKAVPLAGPPELKTPPQQPGQAQPSGADAKKPVAGTAPVEQTTAPAAESPAAASEAVKQPVKPGKAAEAETPKPPVKKTEKTASAAKSKDGRYVVQVIALADAGKAKQMQQQITAAGIKSYTEVVKTAKGDVTRVRAGPFATRKAADRAREQLKSIGMSGNVTAR